MNDTYSSRGLIETSNPQGTKSAKKHRDFWACLGVLGDLVVRSIGLELILAAQLFGWDSLEKPKGSVIGA